MSFRHTVLIAIALATLGTATPALGTDQPITANTTVTGRLEPGDARRDQKFVDTYVYNGEAGEELFLSSQASIIEITGPNRFSQRAEANDDLLVRLPARGRYRIAVFGGYYSTESNYRTYEDYELNILQINTTRNPTTLEVGQTINGSFSLDDPIQDRFYRYDTYTYNATAGEVVGLLVQSVGIAASVRVTGPSSGGSRFRMNPYREGEYFHFDVAGEHQIKVVAQSAGAGNYTLSVVHGHPADAAPPTATIALGENVVVAAQPGVLDENDIPTGIYTISAHRGDRLAVMTTPISYQTRVIAPDGSRVSGQEIRSTGASSALVMVGAFMFQAPADGQYRIQVPARATSARVPVTFRVLSAADGTAALANWETDRIARIAQLTRRGEQLLSSGANEDATVVLQEILSLDWRNVFAHISLGNLEYRRGELVDARHHFSIAAEDDPNNQSAQNGLRLVQEAELARERNWQLQQEHWARQRAQWAAQQAQADRERQQRDAAAIGNAIGVFTGVYNATVEAQRQADAQARAQAEAQAEAQARAQADAQAAANARAAQQAPSSSGSSSGPNNPAVSQPGANNCALVRSDHIENTCNFIIMIAVEYQHPRDGILSHSTYLHPHARYSHPRGFRRLIVSCNGNQVQGAVREGSGWVCR